LDAYVLNHFMNSRQVSFHICWFLTSKCGIKRLPNAVLNDALRAVGHCKVDLYVCIEYDPEH